MSALNLRLPESLHRQVRELAQRDKVSINQFVTLAVAEKLAALRTERYFRERAARAQRADFLAILDQAGSDVSLAGDVLPPGK